MCKHTTNSASMVSLLKRGSKKGKYRGLLQLLVYVRTEMLSLWVSVCVRARVPGCLGGPQLMRATQATSHFEVQAAPCILLRQCPHSLPFTDLRSTFSLKTNNIQRCNGESPSTASLQLNRTVCFHWLLLLGKPDKGAHATNRTGVWNETCAVGPITKLQTR